ncbi:MAG: tetratricopeptide repeat protein, partial [Prolixibacteraceae bacterium]|nr:tetratricopeptide repeat protein [Prolixibacteraceae bacterium]
RARLAAEAEAAEQSRLAAIEAERERKYNDSIGRGDSLFTLEQYEDSRTSYQSALKVKPGEDYPEQRITEIGDIIRKLELARVERERIDRDYESSVKLADQQFNAKDYNHARANYEKALASKPGESYPSAKITEIDNILKQQELDENYRNIIIAADGLFKTESYTEAKNQYENALAIKPEEKYPASQIIKIENYRKEQESRLLSEQQSAVDLEQRRQLINQQQLELRELEVMSEASLSQLYDEYITNADNYFDNKLYNVSRAWYYKAWDLRPSETYPPARIDEINRLVSSMLLNNIDRDYQRFVNLADSTFRENQLAVSRGWYNRALSVKSAESYPREQLQEIEKIIEERLAGRSGELFESHLQKANDAFQNGNYNVARFWYKKALELRPDDTNVKARLEEIQTITR